MTVRALVIGIVCVLALAIAIPYCDLVMHGTWVGLTAFPISTLFTFVVLALGINYLLRKLKLGLTSTELLLMKQPTPLFASCILLPRVMVGNGEES